MGNPDEFYGDERMGLLSKGEAQNRFAQLDFVPPEYQHRLAPGWQQRWFGGAIRNLGAAGGYWKLIDDGAHWPFGVARVETTTVGIDLYYDFEAAGIGTVLVGTDETMQGAGWTAGASVFKDKCTIKIGRRKTIGDHVTWDGSKFTSSAGVFTPTWSPSGGGMLVLTHERMFGFGYSVTPMDVATDAVIGSGTTQPATETRVKLINRATGAQIATTAEIPTGTRVYVSRTDALSANQGQLNPQSAPDQTELPDSNLWFLGVHHTGPRPV